MAGKTKLETFKEESAGLRGSLADEIGRESPDVCESAQQILKFHGTYLQDDRDARRARQEVGRARAHSFMVRSKIPGGRLTAEQYLVHDALAREHANGTLRITTRQDLQLHGVLKGDLRASIRAIDRALLTTLGACGDVVRNVMCCPLPAESAVRGRIAREVDRLSRHFLPRTGAYHEIWLDGERAEPRAEEDTHTADRSVEEPLYGSAYLPRKFKIGFSLPGDNCVDVHTQDVGLVPLVEAGVLRGCNVLVGGGQGMTHKKPQTFPRLADPMAFVEPDLLLPVVEAIVVVQRDHGDRTDRRHARLKYLVHDWGLDRFRRAVELRLGRRLAAPLSIEAGDLELHLGWSDQGDGRWCLGLLVENGRIRDHDGRRMLSALRSVVERYRPGVRLTAHQDLLLTDLEGAARPDVERILRDHGIEPAEDTSVVRAHAMACPALPTCGLALAEAERALPAVLSRLEAELAHMGLADERITVRMTGCPNGCARPYVAEIGFVGRSLGRYLVLLGGRRDGTRLNRPYRDLVPLEELVDVVLPMLRRFRRERRRDETFGDYCHRVLPQVSADAVGPAAAPAAGKAASHG